MGRGFLEINGKDATVINLYPDNVCNYILKHTETIPDSDLSNVPYILYLSRRYERRKNEQKQNAADILLQERKA